MTTEGVQEPEGTEPDNTPQGEQTQQGEPEGTDTAPKGEEFWKAQARKNEAAKKREAERVKALEDRIKGLLTPEQVQTERQQLDEAQRRIAELETRDLKRSIGAETGLPPEMWDRLQGADEDAIREDAKALKALVKPATPAVDAKKGQAAATPAVKPDANELLRQIIASR